MQPERRSRPPQRRLHLFELVVITAFIAIIGFCTYDGFKEIFTTPKLEKAKDATESLAELKAQIAQSKKLASHHKYVKYGRGERRSALASEINITEPVMQMNYAVLEEIPESQSQEEELKPYTRVVVLSALQESPCLTDGGDELHFRSVKNKQDYARLHGYEFVLGMKQVDPGLENMWNKPAWMNKVLEDDDLQAEWVLWVDIDTVILDLNFTLALDEYAAKSKDLVVYGNITQVQAGHPVQALNTGVMLVHNTPWSRRFFSEVARLGRLDDHHKGKNTLSKILLKELQADAYSDGLRDQNAVIYLLKVHPEWQDRVAFLDKEVCLNCYWKDLVGVTGYAKPDYDRLEDVSFIQHFMGCQICNALNRNGDLEQCQKGMFHSFDYLQRDRATQLASLGERGENHLSQLRELPYCSANPEVAPECKGAKPLNEEQRRIAEGAKKTVGKFDWRTIDSSVVDATLDNLRADLENPSRDKLQAIQAARLQSESEQDSTGSEASTATVQDVELKDPIHSVEKLDAESDRLREKNAIQRREARSEESGPRKFRGKRIKRTARLKTAANDAQIARTAMLDVDDR